MCHGRGLGVTLSRVTHEVDPPEGRGACWERWRVAEEEGFGKRKDDVCRLLP